MLKKTLKVKNNNKPLSGKSLAGIYQLCILLSQVSINNVSIYL